jgi:regulation of enolase protein 1 (concanavalin A-like superfamily)
MACSPERAGFEVVFTGFDITTPIDHPLHDPG